MYTMDHPELIVCSFMENSIGLNRVKVKEKRKKEMNIQVPSLCHSAKYSKESL